MLDASYFDGSRLQMYLDIMKDFQLEQVQQAAVDVKEEQCAIVSVDFGGDGDFEQEIKNVVDIVQKDDDVVEMDVVVSSVYNAVVSVCSTPHQVGRNSRDWSKYYKKDFSQSVKVIVRNGQWSREVRCKNLGILFTSKGCRQVRVNNRDNLQLVRYDKAWVSAEVERYWMCSNLVFRNIYQMQNGINSTEFWNFNCVMIDLPGKMLNTRHYVGNLNGSLVIMDHRGVVRRQIGVVRTCDFLAECFVYDGKVVMLDLLEKNRKQVNGTFFERYELLRGIVDEFNSNGYKYMYCITYKVYSHKLCVEDFPEYALVFRGDLDHKSTVLFSVRNAQRSLHRMKIVRFKKKIACVATTRSGRDEIIKFDDSFAPWENMVMECRWWRGRWEMIKISSYVRVSLQAEIRRAEEEGITLAEFLEGPFGVAD